MEMERAFIIVEEQLTTLQATPVAVPATATLRVFQCFLPSSLNSPLSSTPLLVPCTPWDLLSRVRLQALWMLLLPGQRLCCKVNTFACRLTRLLMRLQPWAGHVGAPWVQPYYRPTDVLVAPIVDRREPTHLWLSPSFTYSSSAPVILRTLYSISTPDILRISNSGRAMALKVVGRPDWDLWISRIALL